jgi:protoheme IX farnesyltransferase
VTRPCDFVALTKPRVTALVAVTAAGGLLLARASVPVRVLLALLAGTWAVVGAANALNCWVERDLDARMARTRDRPLPSGRLAPGPALAFSLALATGAIVLLAVGTNLPTTALGFGALVTYVGVYTPLKRRTPLALLVGAVPGAAPPLMGWTAATGRLEDAALVLGAILFLWQVPHFVAIGLLHRDDYARAGFRMLPVAGGTGIALAVAVAAAALLVPVTLLLGPAARLASWYPLGAALLGSAMLGVSLLCARTPASRQAARRLLLASLAYLPLLFALIVTTR